MVFVRTLIKLIFASFLLLLVGCSRQTEIVSVSSPNEKIQLVFDNSESTLTYRINYKGEEFLRASKLGFDLVKAENLDSNFVIVDFQITTSDESWEQPWGEERIIRDHYNKLTVNLQERDNLSRKISLEFKVFDDGIGFRYLVPEQVEMDSVYIKNELTQFAFTDSHKTWSTPAYHIMKYETLYSEASLKNLDTCHTPITIKTSDGVYASIHEAALTDFASITLYGNEDNTLKTDLVPWKDGVKVKIKVPFQTPWRTIQIAEKPGDLIESHLILNLNEPNVLGDVSWVKPMKYVGIWWGMHIGIFSFYQGPKVGATTERAKKYIDFAAKHGFEEVLIEGWNYGWTPYWGSNFAPEMDFTRPAEAFNWKEVIDYAKSKNVFIQAYNETAANTENYLSQIDSAFALYEKLGYRSVKVGQVNDKFKNGEWHHGQYGVNYYRTVAKKGAQHKLAINFHEPIKPTGIRRTYPNIISREGARGQEFNAWDDEGGNPPEHTCILPFTRLLAGPMDFTPGIFLVEIPQREDNQVNTTLAKQLALYVVLYSPIQMAADLIENYESRIDALQFIKDVPVDWETTSVIDAAIADYIIIARKDKYSEDWYLGAITDENSRDFDVNLNFLNVNQKYEAQIYKDAEGTDYQTNPGEYEILNITTSSQDILEINLPSGGGTAIRFKKINK